MNNSLIVPDSAADTAVNILENESLFRFGAFTFILILILGVLVAWALYIPADHGHSRHDRGSGARCLAIGEGEESSACCAEC